MATVDLSLNLSGIKESAKNIEKFSDTSSQQLGALNKSLAGLKKTTLAIRGAFVAVFAIRQFSGAVSEIINLANVQEDAVNRLNQSLKNAGVFSKEASKDIQDFATSISSVTTVGDETVIDLVALATAFTGSADQAKELTAAALDFAQGAGIAAEEAVRRLGRATKGSVDDVAKFAPAIKDLTKEQLANGEASKLIAERFSGAAAALRNTFSGSVEVTSGAMVDLKEEIGFLITKNQSMIRVVQLVGEGFYALRDAIADNSDAIAEFVTKGIVGFSKFAKGVVFSIDFLRSSFNVVEDGILAIIQGILQANKAVAKFNPFANKEAVKSAQNQINIIKEIRKENNNLASQTKKSFRTVQRTIDTVAGSFENISKAARSSTAVQKDLSKQNLAITKQELAKISTSFNQLQGQLKNVGKTQIEVLKEQAEERSTILNQALEANLLDEQRHAELITKVNQDLTVKLDEIAKKQVEGQKKANDEQVADAAATVTEISDSFEKIGLASITKGLQGAVEAGAQVLGSVLGQNLGGNIAGQMFSVLTQSTDQFNSFLDNLFSADFISNLANNLTALLLKLLDPSVLLNVLKNVIEGFAELVSNTIRTLLSKLTFGLIKAPKVRSPEPAANLQSGGTVPSGFPNDSFRANLSSGELVVPKNDVRELREFLQEQDRVGGRPMVVKLQVGQKDLADVMVDLNRRGFRTA